MDLDGYGIAHTPHGAQTELASAVTAGAREVRNSRHTVVDVAGQSILDPLSTEIELLSHGRDIDSAATQILFLRSLREQVGQPIATRMSQSQRERAHAVLQRVRVLTERYPDITRYTS